MALDSSSGNNVEVFAINPSSGVLTAVSGSPFDVGLSNPDGAITTHPNGKWVYACDWSSTNIVSLDFSATSGTPTKTGTVPLSTATSNGCNWAPGITVTPNGKYLYAADYTNAISAYTINQSTGALTAAGSMAGNSGSYMGSVVASNNYVYAAPYNDTVYIAAIGSNGTPGTPTPVSLGTGYSTGALALDWNGSYLIVGDGDGAVTSYKVSSTGLTKVTATTVAGGCYIEQLAMSRDNTFVYAADDCIGIGAFAFDAKTGTLAAVTGSPYASTVNYANSVSVDPSNKFVYADTGCNNIYGWARDTSTGKLTGIGETTASGGDVCMLTTTF